MSSVWGQVFGVSLEEDEGGAVVVSAALTARRGHKKAGGATQEIVMNLEPLCIACARVSLRQERRSVVLRRERLWSVPLLGVWDAWEMNAWRVAPLPPAGVPKGARGDVL